MTKRRKNNNNSSKTMRSVFVLKYLMIHDKSQMFTEQKSDTQPDEEILIKFSLLFVNVFAERKTKYRYILYICRDGNTKHQ